MIKITRGITRTVILTNSYAFKFPGTYDFNNWLWYRLLQGLLGNMQEVQWSKNIKNCKDLGFLRLNPVIFYIPGGFLIIMKRGLDLTDQQWNNLDYNSFIRLDNGRLPVENKRCSFKSFNNIILAVDYGS